MHQRPEVLYADLNPQLLRILRRNLNAPEGLLEDACQIAWGSLLLRRGQITPGCELAWLSTTATRIALRQLRDRASEVPYDESGGGGRVASHASSIPSPHELVELHERLAEVDQLPVRQARMLWMRGVGYGYAEISELTGDSERTVERQLHKATRRLSRDG